MRLTRRRTDRPDPARCSLGSGLEMLESRELLSNSDHPFAPFLPSDLPVRNPITNHRIPLFSIAPLVHQAYFDPQAPFLNNEGKIVSGKDRQGNEWTITVHGPGTVLVTDVSPNDGVLDDNIDTIQLLHTDPRRTYVTGDVYATARPLPNGLTQTGFLLFRQTVPVSSNGTVAFNKLIATTGVKSVVLNGFTLQQTVTPPTAGFNQNPALFLNTGIYLTGGVQLLQFHNIVAPSDLGTTGLQPINIVIGDPSTPLPKRIRPTIRLDSIFNTVINSTATTLPITPLTTPTVNILVNGELHGLDFVSTTNTPMVAGQQILLPTVGTTGRTAVRAFGIDRLHVRGTANNFTASRGAQPFQNSFSGLDHLGAAAFGGNADAVGLDVRGKIGGLRFARGLGNPTGAGLSYTKLGTPVEQYGYPSAGVLGGLVTSTQIGHATILPANVLLQTPTNPDFVQLFRQGNTAYFPRNGNALTSAAIVSAGSIGRTTIVGNTVNSEIKSGFDYPSFAAGLEGTRARSRIAPLRQSGDAVEGVTSATYRPAQFAYGTIFDTAGPGLIRGNLHGVIYKTGQVTALGNTGTGFFARRKIGYLPPPQAPKRVHGVLVR